MNEQQQRQQQQIQERERVVRQANRSFDQQRNQRPPLTKDPDIDARRGNWWTHPSDFSA